MTTESTLLPPIVKIVNSSDKLSDKLSITGVHVLDGPIKGYKFLNNCVVQSYTDMLTGSWKEYDKCYAEVEVEKGKQVVRPKWRISPLDTVSSILRTNGLHCGEIKTASGQICASGNGEYKDGIFRPNKSYTNNLNVNVDNEFGRGLHFSLTEESEFNIKTMPRSYTEYSWWGQRKKQFDREPEKDPEL